MNTYIKSSSIYVNEGDEYAEFKVELTQPSLRTVTVDYSTSAISAGTYGDYYGLSGTLTFEPGQTSKSIQVLLKNDSSVEVDQNLGLILSNPTNALVADGFVYATIVDDDSIASTADPAVVSVNNVYVDESEGVASFIIKLSKSIDESLTVEYSTRDVSATSGSDYVQRQDSITFNPGEVVKTITVDILDDTISENSELFELVLKGLSGAGVSKAIMGADVGQALIGDNDGVSTAGLPYITTKDVMVSADATYAEVVVQLTSPSADLVAFDYKTTSISAGTYGDYYSTAGKMFFLPGETQKVINVPLKSNPSGIFGVELNNASNAIITDPFANIVVASKETLAQTASPANLYVNDVVVDEKDGFAYFDVVMDKRIDDTITVYYSTRDVSARAGEDYVAQSGKFTFNPGETHKRIAVEIIDDVLEERDELFQFNLESVVGDGISFVKVTKDSAIGLIGRNDSEPTALPKISSKSVIVSEQSQYAEFTVHLDAPSSDLVSVDYSTKAGSAGTYGEYYGTSGSLYFKPGETTKTIKVPLRNDGSVESTEVFYLNLVNPTGATVSTSQLSATIIDNDDKATTLAPANLIVRDLEINEKDQIATFNITLDKGVDQVFSVDFATNDKTAQAGVDYASSSGTIHFDPWHTVQKVTVEIHDDKISEGAESFLLTLSNLSGDGKNLVKLTDPEGEGVILANYEPSFITNDETLLGYAGIQQSSGSIISSSDAQLYRSYFGALGRLPDRDGFEWWSQQIQSGKHTLGSMASGFINSNEFMSLADSNMDGRVNNEELISHIYTGLFGRLPDQAGFDWWVNQLNTGAKDQSTAFVEMTQSNEYAQLTLVAVSEFDFL